jgi:enoyl-CoA hydratase
MKQYNIDGDNLLIEVAESIALVTLNRPQQHNALSRLLRENLSSALKQLEADNEVGVIIITGAGDKAFSVGADLKEFEAAPLKAEEMGVDCPVMQAFERLSKPTIAAINGYTVTGGFELATNCDILVASTNAKFADTHARVGVVPAWGLTQYLAMLIGPVRARYLSFTGNYLDAQTAKEWGLVLDVVAPEALIDYCRKLAREMLSCDRRTLAEIRRAMRLGLHRTVEEGLQLEAKLAKSSVERFDAASFARTRQAVMNRGKTQVGGPSGPCRASSFATAESVQRQYHDEHVLEPIWDRLTV